MSSTTNVPNTFAGANDVTHNHNNHQQPSISEGGHVNTVAPAAAAAAAVMISEKKPGPTYYHAVRKCKGLDGPVIFLRDHDARRFLSQDKSSVHERFANIDDADAWLRGRKKSRKRKSIEDFDNNSKPMIMTEVIEKNDQLWEQKFQELKTFTETIGDGNPNLAMQKEYRAPHLQAWLSGQRRNYARYINNEVNEARSQFDRRERFYKLLELGVKLKPEEITGSWKETALKWREFTLENPSIILPEHSSDEKIAELAEWQNRQIVDYIKMMRKEQPHEMYPHRVKLLREWDFPFPKDVHTPKKVLKTFDERVQEFVDWKAANGTAMVPQSLDGLGEWVKEQRKEHRKKLTGKKTCMTDERLAKLIAAGFVFRIRNPRRKSGASVEEEQEMGPLAPAPVPLEVQELAQVPLSPQPLTATEI